MADWIDYYDAAPSVYVSPRHRDVHFQIVADDIRRLIASHADAGSSRSPVVIDFACGEALSAARVAEMCGTLILAEAAPSLRQRLAVRFAKVSNIKVLALDELAQIADGTVDLVVMNSVLQYMTAEQLQSALVTARRLLSSQGQLVIGDVLQPDTGMLADVRALLKMAARHGFLMDAVTGLARTALSDYSLLRKTLGLKRYSEHEMLAMLRAEGFSADRCAQNLGHNPSRMTFAATPA